MTSPAKGPGGRPSLYDPAYCDQIIDFMANGYSVTAFAGSIRVSRQTVYNWADENPEFFDALKTAQAVAALWWEQRLRDTAEKGEGSATAAIFGLKNRAADDWREKTVSEVSGPNGGPIQTEDVTADADAFTRAIASLSAGGGTGKAVGGADAGNES